MLNIIRLKFWFFQNYWWILIIIGVAIISGWWHNTKPATSITVAGTILSVLYFLQRQKLDELKLFRSLFKEFNDRYDSMNERLAQISSSDKDPSEDDEQLIIDYFNLCSEEYLYYRKGYIDPVVWTAWFNGAKSLISTPPIKELWEREKQSNSYYGLENLKFY